MTLDEFKKELEDIDLQEESSSRKLKPHEGE
jgi:hypothetical protein